MKAITIKEPFASLIIEGHKKYEYRSWKTKYRGKILIHAGLGKYPGDMSRFDSYEFSPNKGFILGEAEIVDCILVTEEIKKELLKEDPIINKHAEGYAFKLANIKKYNKPIPAKGKLSLWEFNL